MDLLGDLISLIYLISIILLFVMIFLERSEPRVIMIWGLILLLLPVVGFILYLFLGQTFYHRKQFSIKSLDDERIAELRSGLLEESNRIHRTEENSDDYDLADLMMSAGGSIYSSNNDVRFYGLGDQFFKDLFEDLRNAKNFIHFEFYILRNDDLTNEFMDIMIQKVKEGLDVKMMIDAIGNNKGPKKRIKEFKKAGGEYTQFHSNFLYLFSPKKNNRNHRKLTVIDGNIGYVAGFNIGDEYLGKGKFGYWRDSAIRVHGEGAVPIHIRFLMDWKYTSKKDLDLSLEQLERYYPVDMKAEYGNDLMQLVSGGPDTKDNPIEYQYLGIIGSAKRTLYIHTPYLAPTEAVFKALIMAARSGVDVRIIMPDKPDHPFVFWVSLWYAGELIKKGIRVYQYNKGFVHAKDMVADGRFCSVGSANLDIRSISLNFESNAMVCSEKIGKEMDDLFMDDLADCKEYTMEDHNNLTRMQNIKISVSRLFSFLA